MARGSVGVHLADGTFVVRRAAAGAPVVASLLLPEAANVALDPRCEVVAYADASRVSLVTLAGASLGQAELLPDVVVRRLEFRADGERLWVFGSAGATLRAYVFDRKLALLGDHGLDLGHDPAPFSVHLHPTEDAFTVLTNEDGRDPELPMRFMAIVVEAGQPRVVFSKDEIDYPCIGFTSDGRFLVGVDAFNGVTLWRWPDHERIDEALLPEGDESRFDGAVIGDHLLTERHAAGTSDSALLVLAVPSLTQEALITWSARGDFGEPDDDAGADLGGALGADCFLEVKSGASEGAWILRVWRLSAR